MSDAKKKQKRVEASVMNGKTFPRSLFLFVVLCCSINFLSEEINFLRKILLSVGIERYLREQKSHEKDNIVIPK
jgi:hypothetical protein